MTQDKHSPLPFRKASQRVNEPTDILDSSGNMIAFVPVWGLPDTDVEKESQSNAAFIVRAVNNHYQLIEVVEKVAALNPEVGEIGDGMLRNLVSLARQALSNANGGVDPAA